MFKKNTVGQFIHFQGVDTSTGGIKSGVTWTVRRCIDGTFAAATGTVTEDGTTGWYKFAMSQADTNGNNIGFNFTGIGAVPQTVNIITDGNVPDVNVTKVGGTTQTAGDIIGDTNDIQSRLPAALVSGRIDASVGFMGLGTITAFALATDAVTEIQSGLATSSALATAQTDLDDIQTRIPTALSGDGFIKADLKSIDDELTTGNNATLNLKFLNIVNNAREAMRIESSSQDALKIIASGVNGDGIQIDAIGTGSGLNVTGGNAGGHAINIYSPLGGNGGIDVFTEAGNAISLYGAADGLFIEAGVDGSNNRVGVEIISDSPSGGKSISVLQDITVSDGDLTLANVRNGLAMDSDVQDVLTDIGNLPSANDNALTLLKYDWTGITGEATRSVLNALRKLRNKVSFSGSTLSIKKEDDATDAFTQSVTQDSDQEPFKSVG